MALMAKQIDSPGGVPTKDRSRPSPTLVQTDTSANPVLAPRARRRGATAYRGTWNSRRSKQKAQV